MLVDKLKKNYFKLYLNDANYIMTFYLVKRSTNNQNITI